MSNTSLRERVLATMKSEDTESAFELYVTRTPGYLWALLFRSLHIHPIVVTLMSIVIGASAGYFFYFQNLRMNLIGMGLLIWANWYDCADGQLARMTGQRTLVGRLLDGLAGDIWFFCIYLGLVLRMQEMYGWWAWLLMAYSGLYCHTQQTAIADYYRNIHLWFLLGKGGSELDSTEQESKRFHELRWRRGEWFEKMYLFFYYSYTRRQERQAPKFQHFYKLLRQRYGDDVPTDLRQRFREKSLPLMKYTNILTFDTRVGVMFLSLIIGQPIIFPLFEIGVLEPLRYYMRHRHETFCQTFYEELVRGEK